MATDTSPSEVGANPAPWADKGRAVRSRTVGEPALRRLERADGKLPERLRVYPRLVVLAYVITTVIMFTLGSGSYQDALFTDFTAFQTAAVLHEQGALAAAYDAEFAAPLQAELRGTDKYAPFYYPPSYMFLISWIDLFDFRLSALIIMVVTGAFLVWTLRHYATDRHDIWILCAAPALFVNFGHGQNAFLTAGLALLALHHAKDRPWIAGLALAALTVKPQLGVLFPVYLLMIGAYSTFAIATVGALVLGALSYVVFGAAAWEAFFGTGLSELSWHVREGMLPINTYASPFGLFLTLGAPVQAAIAVQLAWIIGLLGIVGWGLRRGVRPPLMTALMLCAILLATPHAFTYDWVFPAAAMFIIWCEGRKEGFLPWEAPMVIATLCLPVAILFLSLLPFPVAPFFALVPMFVVLRRVAFELRFGSPNNPIERTAS